MEGQPEPAPLVLENEADKILNKPGKKYNKIIIVTLSLILIILFAFAIRLMLPAQTVKPNPVTYQPSITPQSEQPTSIHASSSAETSLMIWKPVCQDLS